MAVMMSVAHTLPLQKMHLWQLLLLRAKKEAGIMPFDFNDEDLGDMKGHEGLDSLEDVSDGEAEVRGGGGGLVG